MSVRLEGRAVLVTGSGTDGIGHAIAWSALSEGASVALHVREKPGLRRTSSLRPTAPGGRPA